MKKLGIFSMICLALFLFSARAKAVSPFVIPNPVLVFKGSSYYTANGNHLIRYSYFVMNSTDYPGAMFAASPALPPCGQNTKASRTWVDLYDQRGTRLNGFCALSGANGLSEIWFGLGEDVVPPSWIYIELNDRQTSTKYKSNLAETTL